MIPRPELPGLWELVNLVAAYRVKPVAAVAPSSSSGFILSMGYNSSKSSRPGASGIGPRIVSHFSSNTDAVTGFCSQATAPAENFASAATFASLLGATKTILASPPCSRISSAVRWPSRDGISRDITTSSGSKVMYSSTALSPSWQISILKSLI